MIITITAMQNNKEITTWGEKNQDFFFFKKKALNSSIAPSFADFCHETK